MPTEKKVGTVAELRRCIASSTIAIGISYQGLKVAELQALRRRLREAGVEMRVVKNTLLRLAAAAAGRPALGQIVQGPTAIAFGYGEMAAAVKPLMEHIRTARLPITVRGACLDGQVVAAADVEELASLPPRAVLLAQVVGGLEAPLAALLGLLEAPLASLAQTLAAIPQQLVGLLEARARQMEAAG